MTEKGSDSDAEFSNTAGPRDRILTVLESPETFDENTPIRYEDLQAAVNLSDAVFETALENLVQNGQARYIPSEGYTLNTAAVENTRQCVICAESIDSDSYIEVSIKHHGADTSVMSSYEAHQSCVAPILQLVDAVDYQL